MTAKENEATESDMVSIPKKRYQELLYAEDDLNALHLGGVSDWVWYDDSLDDHRSIPRY